MVERGRRGRSSGSSQGATALAGPAQDRTGPFEHRPVHHLVGVLKRRTDRPLAIWWAQAISSRGRREAGADRANLARMDAQALEAR